MMVEIEQKALDRLREEKLNVENFEVGMEPREIVAPAVNAWIMAGTFEPAGQTSYRQWVDLYLLVLLKDLGSAEARHEGVYPVVQGVVGLLTEQNLGLSIEPLVPQSFRNVTTHEWRARGYILYQVHFRTGFFVS
jgi:hypothetical protein